MFLRCFLIVIPPLTPLRKDVPKPAVESLSAKVAMVIEPPPNRLWSAEKPEIWAMKTLALEFSICVCMYAPEAAFLTHELVVLSKLAFSAMPEVIVVGPVPMYQAKVEFHGAAKHV